MIQIDTSQIVLFCIIVFFSLRHLCKNNSFLIMIFSASLFFEGLAIIYTSNMINALYGLIISLLGGYFFISSLHEYYKLGTDSSSFLPDMRIHTFQFRNAVNIYPIVGFIIIFLEIIQLYLFNSDIGRNDTFLFFTGFSWIIYIYIPKKYFRV